MNVHIYGSKNGRILSCAVHRTRRTLFSKTSNTSEDWQLVLTFINFIYDTYFALMSYYIPEKLKKGNQIISLHFSVCFHFPLCVFEPLLVLLTLQFSLGRKTFVLWGLPLTVAPFGCFVPDLGNDTRINSLIMKRTAPRQMGQQDCKQSFPLNEWICGRKYITQFPRRLFFYSAILMA